MTGYLTSVLTLLLGWMRGVASSIWKLINGESEGGFWAMLSENWKGILLILCLAGILIDLAVYLLRWRPDKVWVSFIRRVRRRANDRRAYRELQAQPETGAMPQLAEYEEFPSDTAPTAGTEMYEPETLPAGDPGFVPADADTQYHTPDLNPEDDSASTSFASDTDTLPLPRRRRRRSERS